MNFIYPTLLLKWKNSSADLSYCVVLQVVLKTVQRGCKHYSVSVNDIEVWHMCLLPPPQTTIWAVVISLSH